MSQSGAGSAGGRRRTTGPGNRGSSGSTLSARLAAAAAANAAANQPTIFGLLAGKRLAKQFANRIYAKRAANSDGNGDGYDGVEPTYRMEPTKRFDVKKVEAILKEVIDPRIKDFRYSARRGAMMAKILSEEVKEAVKEMEYDRYKLICLVTIGENRNQDMRITSRCTWDLKTDNSASYSWQSQTFFCAATVFGMYHE